MKNIQFNLIVLLSILILPFNFLQGQCISESGKLLPTPIIDGINGFGNIVAIDGNIAVIGANTSDSLQRRAGLVYVYEYKNNGWIKIASLFPSNPSADYYFGSYLDISGDKIVVGVPVNKEMGFNAGVVYVYEKPADGIWKTGTETYKVFPNSPLGGQLFGSSVSIKNDYLLVGAPRENFGQQTGTGAAYLFKNENNRFQEICKLTPSSRNKQDIFGETVKFSEDLIVVASIDDFDDVTHSGSVFVYEKPPSGWVSTTETAKLTGTNTYGSLPEFGHSISIHENSILVGAYRYPFENAYWAGAAFLYEKPAGGWVNSTETAIFSYSQKTNDQFGTSVFLTNDYAFIGKPGGDIPGVCIFKKPASGWKSAVEDHIVYAPGNSPNYKFGTSIALGEQCLLVGSTVLSPADEMSSVFSYDNPSTDWLSLDQQPQHLSVYSSNASASSFGQSIATYGNFTIVGAPGDMENGVGAGAAYVFEYDGTRWNKVAKLTPSDGKAGDAFGTSVSIYEDKIIIGSYLSDHYQNGLLKTPDIGAAYIFNKTLTGWKNGSEDHKITLDGINSGAMFGFAVDVDKDYAVVTSFNEGSTESNNKAYVFKFIENEWKKVAELHNIGNKGNFGRSVAIEDKTIVVGAGMLHFYQFLKTYVYVFTKDGEEWENATEKAILSPQDDKAGSLFGFSVDISNDQIIAGAPAYNGNASFSGCAYVFEKPSGGWVSMKETAKLTASEELINNNLGYSVAINENTALMGAPSAVFVTANADYRPGKVLTFEKKGQWISGTEDHIMEVQNEIDVNRYGVSVAFHNNEVVVGASHDNNETGNKAGAVYVKVNEQPKIDFLPKEPQFFICKNENLEFFTSFDNGDKYDWLFSVDPEGEFTPAANGIDVRTYKPGESGFYKLKVEKDGCTYISEFKEVKIQDSEAVVIPNIFTPNGDSFNEYFEIKNVKNQVRLSIYDRWGKLIYNSIDYKNNWNGDKASSGVYYFIVDLEDNCLNRLQKKGWVHLLR